MNANIPFFRIKHDNKHYKVVAITIAYENSDVILKQINQFKLYGILSIQFKLIIADNSKSPRLIKEIKKICKDNHIDYYHVKYNPYTGTSHSDSHGYALNWAAREIATNYISEWVGFLDHDIFLLGSANDFYSNLTANKVAYGVIQTRGDRWYLWPGFCFFKSSYFKIKDLDFRPVAGLDTGGANWQYFFSKISTKNIRKANINTIYTTQDGSRNKQRDAIQIIDNIWLHLINASNWADSDNMKKLEELDIILDKYKQ